MSEDNHKIYFLIRSYKSYDYFDKCIDSVFKQKQQNYTIIFIDDASNYTYKIQKHITKKLKNHIVIFNKKRKFSLRNAYEAIHNYVKEEAIIINLDGDDWLISNNVIETVTKKYNETNCDLTYGNCKYYNPGHKEHNKTPFELTNEINKRFPKEIEISSSYRNYHFLPLHIRTWKAKLFKSIDKNQFLRPNGKWIKFCEDQAMFYPMLEKSKGNYQIIETPLYSYNKSNNLNDLKVNIKEKMLDEIFIRRKK